MLSKSILKTGLEFACEMKGKEMLGAILVLTILTTLNPIGSFPTSNSTSNFTSDSSKFDIVPDTSKLGIWPNHGGGLKNQRNAADEWKITPFTVSKLVLKWRFYAGDDVSATPSIGKDIVYFPSWNGFVYAVGFEDGSLLWKVYLPDLIASTNLIVSRATPVVAGELLIVAIYGPAILVALNRFSGNLVWVSEALDRSLGAQITMSGTPFNGAFYVGVSSSQEFLPVAECCTFQGSFQKIDLITGKIIWRTSMLPDNYGTMNGYSGAAIWGSSPSIDIKRSLVFIATGNLYRAPPEIQACEDVLANMSANTSVPYTSDPCLPYNVHQNSILALYLDTGKIKWSRRLGGFDVWTLTCLTNPSPNCPSTLGPDYDFGEEPMLLSIFQHTISKELDILVAGQKSGVVWALDRDTGDIVWDTVAGPGGSLGGAIWGSATDGHRIYTNIANSDMQNFTLFPSSCVTTGGGWVALDASTGQIEWSTANPTGAPAYGPVTIANGVLFVGSFDVLGHVYALDGKTGSILWSSITKATVYGGFSVARGCAFVGSGYNSTLLGQFIGGTNGNSLFAYCLPAKII